jgi:hypothetical protein
MLLRFALGFKKQRDISTIVISQIKNGAITRPFLSQNGM